MDNSLKSVVCEYVCFCARVCTWLGEVVEGEESKVLDLRVALPLPDNLKWENNGKSRGVLRTSLWVLKEW